MTEKDPTPVIATVDGSKPDTSVPEAEQLVPTEEVPIVGSRKKTPSAENRELQGEVKELKTKQRWSYIGKGVAYAALAATATYGAGRGDQEEAVGVVHADSQQHYAALAENVKINTNEIKALARGQDEAIKQMAKEFRMQVRTVRIYMEGYLAALSRVPAGGNVRRQAAEEAAKVKRELLDKQAQLDAERARSKAAVAAARQQVLNQVKDQRSRPELPIRAKSVRQLLDQKHAK
jgi:hypothetical protein